ncbi:Uncharacterised protein [Enterobacter roggenkampii]|nr:Uncharacterised protein [Enterobacter roggenkampii]
MGRNDLLIRTFPKRLVNNDFFQLFSESLVIQQVSFEIAKQVAHRQHRLQLRNLGSHLLWREIFHALESQLNVVFTTIVRQCIFYGQVNFWGIFGKNAIKIIFGDVNLFTLRYCSRFLPVAEITRNKQFQG